MLLSKTSISKIYNLCEVFFEIFVISSSPKIPLTRPFGTTSPTRGEVKDIHINFASFRT